MQKGVERTVKSFFILLGMGLALLTAGCATVAVHYDCDREVNLTRYYTYKFIQPREGVGLEPVVDNSLMHTRIGRAVERELVSRGYRKAQCGKPDFLIACHMGVGEKVAFTTCRYSSWRGPHALADTGARCQKAGMLILDVVDCENRQLVWRGWATGLVGDAECIQERIDKTVHKIMQKYPHKAG